MGSEAGVGYCNVLKDESWVVKIGLERAWNMGVWWLLLVFDYQVVRLLLSKNHEEDGSYSMLVNQIGDCSLVDRQSSQVAGGFNGGAVAIQRWKLQVLTEGAHPPMCLLNHSWEYFLDPCEVFKG
ncbi:hypothetical protein OIU79_017348 [Salix purpurea]|uniref:Uncharacterized protein n=1 Tax=Salix purpurea TaxID=77065 RepID=A0A9Q1AJR2_SALPP|nr:hypothetical protein OIU79_017348 [Salix purpurea]